MQTPNNGAISSLKSAWGRLREWIKSGAADDAVRVTDEWTESQEFDIHEALTPIGPSASFATKVRRHAAHPLERAGGTRHAEQPLGHVSSHADEHEIEEHLVPDSLGNALAARMLDVALGGSDDDEDDPQTDMHIIEARDLHGEEEPDLDPTFDLVTRRPRLSTHH